MRDTDYDPTTCPAAGCNYEDSIRAVAAHVSGTDDERHAWDNLVFDGARDFVMQEKRRQRDEAHSSTSATQSTALDATPSSDSPSRSSSTTSSPPSNEFDADEPVELDLDFARDALLLFDLVHRYDAATLEDLDTFRLVNLYTLLSTVSRGADDARKQVRDVLADSLQDDREVAADFGSVRRYTAQRRNLKDERVVRAELERAGIDPREATSFDTKKLRQFAEERGLDEASVFDIEERTYVKKSSEDADDQRRDAFERLDREIRALVEDL
ncbi:hypothetical protein [Haladaptatus sp. NG-WS-4]